MSGEEESKPIEIFPSFPSSGNDSKIEEEFIENTINNDSKPNKPTETDETEPTTEEVQKNMQVESVQDNTENTIDKSINIDNVTVEDGSDTGDKGDKSVDENKAKENEDVDDSVKGNKNDFEDEEEMIEDAITRKTEMKNKTDEREKENKGYSEGDVEMIGETSIKKTESNNNSDSEEKNKDDSEDSEEDVQMIDETSIKKTEKINSNNSDSEKKNKDDSEDDVEMIEETSMKKTKENEDGGSKKEKKGDFEDDDEVIEEARITKTQKENQNISDDFEDDDDDDVIELSCKTKTEKKPQGPPNIPFSKDSSTFRMHLTTEEIDKMINDGTLEKVGEGHYRVRPESVKNLKSTPLALAKELDLQDRTSNTIPVSSSAATNMPVAIQEPTANVLGTSVATSLTPAQIAALPLVQQAPLIALMPVNQVPANAKNNAFIALPMQQSSTTVAYSPALPTFVAISQTATPTQTTVSTSLIPTASEIKVVPSSVKTVGRPKKSLVVSKSSSVATSMVAAKSVSSVTTPVVVSKSVQSVPTALVVSKSSPSVTSPMVASKSAPTVAKSSTSEDLTASESSDLSPKVFNVPVTSGVKRKPIFDVTKIKRPYKFAKLTDKPKRKSSLRNIVDDINTSDEEEDGGLSKCKSYGAELASMFFKKVGEPKTTNKSLLDKLHKAIFNDSDSDQESNCDSEIEEVIEKVKTGKADHHIVNCPGPSKYEASIGPANNSKLSIVRCQEVRHTKDASYELYKVRVISAGREANTNILIPIPEGYKLNFPPKPRDEYVEFSHTPHEDNEAVNNVSPLFLEKLAKAELKLRKYKDQMKVLRGRYIELLQEYSNRPQFSTISDLVGSAAKFLTEDQLVFFLMQIKGGAHNMQGIRYSVREKVLALSIYQKSPEVYKWLSKMFNLPSKRILDQWLEEVGSQDPKLLKKLMYYIYVSYNFKADA
ncbi:hypothetical protein Anas_00670 [Armadillidium nasatum]|uniref:Uncharacterized protein n=1 Tax=Armadillidium nasatum TaxID=96803 RepID=A0A5N5TKH4_9CRUS|nr:hypothetical protein Anas_00670 [Armadillidium nasatum]